MKHQVTGSCLCGAVSYCIKEKAPLQGTYCHCRDCQKTTGTAFIFVVPALPENFELTVGKLLSHTRTADSGNMVTNNFCPNCGTTLFFGTLSGSNPIWVQSGTLDEPENVTPEQQIWTKRKLPWCRIDPEIPNYDENPI